MYVKIMSNCIACGACESINDSVFQLDDHVAHVKTEHVAANVKDCINAAIICPTNAILITE